MDFYKKIPLSVRIAMKYGLYSALLLFAVLVGLFYADRHPLLIPVIMDVRILLLAIFIYFAIKEFRDIKNNRILHLWQGLIIGFSLAITMGLLAAIFILLFGALEPAFLTEFIEKTTLQLTTNKDRFLEGIGEEAYNNALAKLPGTTLAHLAFDYFLKTLGLSFFITIIISIILRKQEVRKLPFE